MSFVPLQIISSYTLLSSTVTIDKLIEQAKQKGYKALGLTDRNVMYGAVEFYLKCRQADIKPIIGLMLDVKGQVEQEKEFPVLLYAKNLNGYKNLMKLSTRKMTLEENTLLSGGTLENYADDLVAIL